ncbi:MAG TPA: phospholipase D-like domain-containing protein [Candidatus Angelobacter sp.]|nr:phospholipase D-like domain-containing protein [Candidatus Angelobacter sp.]
MNLHLQDPLDPNAPFLQEKILETCAGATCGGGAFAFVTKSGVDLLLNDLAFKAFTTEGNFDLVVGVDEVTNPLALTSLRQLAGEIDTLQIRVFYHEQPNTTFHPKFCWFRHKKTAVLITGSGNLTGRAMRGNWEAFTITEFDEKDATALEDRWAAWTHAHAERLRPLDDPAVIARAEENQRRARRLGPRLPEPLQEPQPPESPAADENIPRPPLAAEGQVAALVAEIPRAGNRWNQANFDLNTFRHFFGAQPGASHRIVLQHVNDVGELGTMESRPSVSVASHNYRFELEAASGLQYPRRGHPIGVFLQIGRRTFRYRLLLPRWPGYSAMRDFLATRYTGRANQMRRVVATAADVYQAWPGSPLWREPLQIED